MMDCLRSSSSRSALRTRGEVRGKSAAANMALASGNVSPLTSYLLIGLRPRSTHSTVVTKKLTARRNRPSTHLPGLGSKTPSTGVSPACEAAQPLPPIILRVQVLTGPLGLPALADTPVRKPHGVGVLGSRQAPDYRTHVRFFLHGSSVRRQQPLGPGKRPNISGMSTPNGTPRQLTPWAPAHTNKIGDPPMIGIVRYRPEPGGEELLCPVICCDVCNKIIDAYHPGNLVYPNGASPRNKSANPRTVHKGLCDTKIDPSSDLYSHELTEVVKNLAENYANPVMPAPGKQLAWVNGEVAR